MRLFRAAAITMVGVGHRAIFLEDRWIDGYKAQEIASSLYQRVPRRTKRAMTVAQVLAAGC